jgi:actin-like ATPase involved in cell morphogenesis
MAEVTHESLKVEIDNMKEDIKEIKFDQKETNKYFREVIDALKENSIRQTEILNNQELQNKTQFSQVKSEISELNQKIDDNIESQTISTPKLFKGILREFGVLTGGFILAVLLFKFGISGGIQK